jgi:hypothetical protein
VDDIETPDETDSLEFLGNGNELEWEGNGHALSPWFHLASLDPSGHFLTVVPTDERGPEGSYPRGTRHQQKVLGWDSVKYVALLTRRCVQVGLSLLFLPSCQPPRCPPAWS